MEDHESMSAVQRCSSESCSLTLLWTSCLTMDRSGTSKTLDILIYETNLGDICLAETLMSEDTIK